MTAHVSGVPPSADASAWWALVMGAAASIEDAANCLRDPDAKKQAEGAAKHYREAAQKLWGARGVPEAVGINGLTEAETSATASVMGIVGVALPLEGQPE